MWDRTKALVRHYRGRVGHRDGRPAGALQGRPAEGGEPQEQRSLRGSDWGPRGVTVRCLIQIQVLGGQAPGSTLAGVQKRSPVDSATQKPRALRQQNPRLSLTRPPLDLEKAACTGGLGYGSRSM